MSPHVADHEIVIPERGAQLAHDVLRAQWPGRSRGELFLETIGDDLPRLPGPGRIERRGRHLFLNERQGQAQIAELSHVDEATGVVSVELTGACATCPASTQTLKAGIERIMKDRVPGVTEVVNVAQPGVIETSVSL